MGKRIIALIASFLLGLVSTPAILSNADDFTPSVAAFDDQKTEVIEKKPEPEQATPAAPNASVAAAPAKRMLNYTVTHVISSRSEYENIAISPSYSDIYRYNKMIFAHNSSNLLGNLSSLEYGETFTVTEGGVTTPYQVTAKITYRYEDLVGNMNSIVATDHTLALMTCAGTPYNDERGASDRLVIFAD